MKIKTGFVTNSSSSSFIVAWPYKIKTFEDVNNFVPWEDRSETILRDSLKQGIKIENTHRVFLKIQKIMSSGYLPGDEYLNTEEEFLKRHNISHKDLLKNQQWWWILHDEETRKSEEVSSLQTIEFINKNEGSFLYTYGYGDEDGEYFSKMEHDGTFQNLSYIRVSHH